MLYVKRLPSAALALLPLAISSAVFAQTQNPAQADQLVVTATRMAQTIDQSLVPVSVLTREDIDRSPATSLPELLSQLPGVDFSISGGYGKTSSLFMRGTSSGHTLVLIDGVKIGSSTLGLTPVEDVSLDQIERIEVVRGPRSSLYGSEAIGGVIQIFTKKPQEGMTGSARLGAGNHNTSEASASLGLGSEQGGMTVNLSRFKTDGIDSRLAYDADQDGYENNNASINVNKEIGDSTKIEFFAFRTEAKNEYDDYLQPNNDYSKKLQQTLAVNFSSALSETWDISGGINQHRDESEAFDSNPGQFRTKRHSADIKSDHYLSDTQVLTLGVDYLEDQVFKDGTNYDRTERTNKAAYGQWQGQLGRWSLLAGARHDDNESYGGKNTGNLNLGYQLSKSRRILVSYGTAFKAPTFNDLYFSSGYAVGNIDLKPEESRSFELGYEFRKEQLSYGARVFRTDIDNLIEWNWWDFYPMKPFNVRSAEIKGLELEGGFVHDQWRGNVSATFLDPRDKDENKVLVKRARRTLQLDLSRRSESLVLSASLLAQGDRYTDADNTAKLPGYAIVNLKTRYELAKNWALEAKVNNVFDKKYSTNVDFASNQYPGLDRTYLLSLSYNR